MKTLNVFVWNSYDNSIVYSADTQKELLYIVKEINKACEIFEQTGLNLPYVEELINTRGMEQTRNYIDGFVQSLRMFDDDVFDRGSCFAPVRYLENE